MSKVILILIDGLRVDTLSAVSTPNIDRIMSKGAWTQDARTVTPSITLPVHLSIFTGMTPGAHGVMTNTDIPDFSEECLSLFQWARVHGRTTAMYYNWEFLRRLAPPGCMTHSVYLDTALEPGGDMTIARVAAQGICAIHPDFAFVYFGCLDETGHAHGYESKAYEKTLVRADEAVGYLLDALARDDAADQYTLFFQSDHGGIEFDHDTACPEVLTIPWMVTGPTVRSGQLVPEEKISTLDTFASILHCMDLPCPSQNRGRVIKEVFNPLPCQ